MSDIRRWRDDPEAPDALRTLLAVGNVPRGMREDERARAKAQLAVIAGTTGAAWWLAMRTWARLFVGSKTFVMTLVAGAIAAVSATAMAVTHGSTHPSGAMRSVHVSALAAGLSTRLADSSRTLPTPPPRVPIEPVADMVFDAPAAMEAARDARPRMSAQPPAGSSRADAATNAGDVDSLSLESALVQRATRELSRDPAATLRLAEQHARDFPRGQLSAERDYLRVRALARLDRSEEAIEAARVFIDAYPSSAFTSRLSHALETGGSLR